MRLRGERVCVCVSQNVGHTNKTNMPFL
jgi:hypothetical protein